MQENQGNDQITHEQEMSNNTAQQTRDTSSWVNTEDKNRQNHLTESGHHTQIINQNGYSNPNCSKITSNIQNSNESEQENLNNNMSNLNHKNQFNNCDSQDFNVVKNQGLVRDHPDFIGDLTTQNQMNQNSNENSIDSNQMILNSENELRQKNEDCLTFSELIEVLNKGSIPLNSVVFQPKILQNAIDKIRLKLNPQNQ